MPKRIQRSRAKGWRMPEGAVYVGRPTKWGNPFSVARYHAVGYSGNDFDAERICVRVFRAWITGETKRFLLLYIEQMNPGREAPKLADLSELRGRNLACWCPLNHMCHADVLLELANQ